MNISPAPWAVRTIELHEGGEGIEVVDANGDAVCNNQTFYPQELKPENAHVIAAAPEMLEALELMIKMYEEVQPAGGYQGVYDIAVYASKKAKGEAT